MNEEISQASNPQLEDADLRAALGFANGILSQTIPSDEMGMDGSQRPQNAPGQEMEQEMTPDPSDDIESKVREAVKEEMAGLREEIKAFLKDDETTEKE